MIERQLHGELTTLLREYPIVTVLGPRQSGKTTLARHYLDHFNYRNLEVPELRQYAIEDPRAENCLRYTFFRFWHLHNALAQGTYPLSCTLFSLGLNV